MRDGLPVLRSKDTAHTAELVSYLFTKLRAGQLLSGANDGSARGYAGLVKKRKRENLTPEVTWQVMLAQVPGMSAHKRRRQWLRPTRRCLRWQRQRPRSSPR